MSSGEKKHDYHLVDPSPWPIFTSFACLVLAVGAVYYFHTKALWLMLIGTALLIYYFMARFALVPFLRWLEVLAARKVGRGKA